MRDSSPIVGRSKGFPIADRSSLRSLFHLSPLCRRTLPSARAFLFLGSASSSRRSHHCRNSRDINHDCIVAAIAPQKLGALISLFALSMMAVFSAPLGRSVNAIHAVRLLVSIRGEKWKHLMNDHVPRIQESMLDGKSQ